ncbi:MAG: lipid-binding SYLF domain-containing protein [Rhodospirillaceae bacterium]|nr:lipid-binding SYLF domain-containing protein [Rhodospirillaceae bacterium]
MTKRISRRGVGMGLAGLAALSAATSVRADDVMDARHVLDEAAITVERVRAEQKSSATMDDYLARSKGVMIIPSYYKAGFILGGSYGDGVLLKRMIDGGGFGDPAFYRMTAGSIGLQAGMQSAAVVFMILTDKGMDAMLNDEFKMGANVGISVGSLGAGAEAATTTNVGNDIVAYSVNAGLFAGGALEGAVIKPRKDWNAAVYGVGNDDPRVIVERNQLRTAQTLKDALSKNVYPAIPGIP